MQMNITIKYTEFNTTAEPTDAPLKNKDGIWEGTEDILYTLKQKLPNILGMMDQGDSLLISFSVIPAEKN